MRQYFFAASQAVHSRSNDGDGDNTLTIVYLTTKVKFFTFFACNNEIKMSLILSCISMILQLQNSVALTVCKCLFFHCHCYQSPTIPIKRYV